MDANTLAALAGHAARLNIAYLVLEIAVLVGMFAFLIVLGERAFGLDLKRFVDNVERFAEVNPWPGVVCFVVVPAALAGIILVVALH